MKTIKYIFILPAFVLFAQSGRSQIIGHLDSQGNAIIDANIPTMMAHLQSVLSQVSNINVVFTSVGIIQVQDENGENYYCIRFTDGETSTTLPLQVLSGGNGTSLNATHISCTTKGCSQTDGCVPNLWGTKCTKCDSDCTKTTTNYDML